MSDNKESKNSSSKRNKGGRPPLPLPKGHAPGLDVRLINQIARVVRQNCRLETAAQSVGVTKRRLLFWMEMGNKAIREGIKTKRDKLYVRFVDEMAKAMAVAENKCVNGIKEAGAEDWKALAFLLTHSPATKEAYAPVIEKIEHDHVHDHQHTGTVTLTGASLDKLSLEDKKRLLDVLKQQKQAQESKPLALPAPTDKEPS